MRKKLVLRFLGGSVFHQGFIFHQYFILSLGGTLCSFLGRKISGCVTVHHQKFIHCPFFLFASDHGELVVDYLRLLGVLHVWSTKFHQNLQDNEINSLMDLLLLLSLQNVPLLDLCNDYRVWERGSNLFTSWWLLESLLLRLVCFWLALLQGRPDLMLSICLVFNGLCLILCKPFKNTGNLISLHKGELLFWVLWLLEFFGQYGLSGIRERTCLHLPLAYIMGYDN